jgi:hypothetical protein
MKLAEALIQRADMQKRLEELRQRMQANAKVQEGDQPAERPDDLLREFDRVADELTLLIQRINRTNTATGFDDQQSVADALAQRDNLARKHMAYRELAVAATITQTRFTRAELRFISTVDVAAHQRRADELAQARRTLDARIQELNWQIELLE